MNGRVNDLTQVEDGRGTINDEIRETRSNIIKKIRESISCQVNTACEAEEMRELANECMNTLNGFYNQETYPLGLKFLQGYYNDRLENRNNIGIQLAACLEIFNSCFALHLYLMCESWVYSIDSVNRVIGTLLFEGDSEDNLEAATRGILAAVADHMALSAFQKLEQLELAREISADMHMKIIQWYQERLLKMLNEFADICKTTQGKEKNRRFEDLRTILGNTQKDFLGSYNLGRKCSGEAEMENLKK